MQRTFTLPQFTASTSLPMINESLSPAEIVAGATWREDSYPQTSMLPSTYTLRSASTCTRIVAHVARSTTEIRPRDKRRDDSIVKSDLTRSRDSPKDRRDRTASVALAQRPSSSGRADHPFSRRCRAPRRLASP